MKLKTILFSLLLGLTFSGAITPIPESPAHGSQNQADTSIKIISEEIPAANGEDSISPLSDLDTYTSE